MARSETRRGDDHARRKPKRTGRKLFGHDRFLLQMSVGTLPHDALMHAIKLYGTVVAPAVREACGS